MANLTDIDPRLRTLQEELIGKVDRLSKRMERGQITPAQWERMMGELIAQGTGQAYRIGKDGPITDIERQPLTQFIDTQLSFLENFKNDIDSGGWLPAYVSRAQMYMTATTTPFNMGDVVRQAGRHIVLPSMPAEGTICHTNCGCSWEIVTINKENIDYDAYWRLGKNDNCQTCVQRARDWSPVEIRGGILL